MSAPVDVRVALLNRERVSWGGTIGFVIACTAAVLIGFWLAGGHS